ncbi:hypothetical protein AWB65_04417 [Caballeronia humi]|uniref:Tle cognate immunity protein 4 N-terminal domain-containing protein n=1 Tax=Caballeronia humi TaxID=326474 RepID=A0A158I8X3_9BURK|nr:hypothetical protein AWB65_04417 [Caballeronia humi]
MNPKAALSILCLALCLSACDKPKALTPRENKTVNDITANLAPRCVGRYLIDMPQDALSFGMTEIQGVRLETLAMTQDAYRDEIAKREAELKSTKSALGYQYLYQHGEARGSGTRYFIRLRSYGDPSDMSRTIEAYKYDRGFRIKFEVQAFDSAHSVFKDEPAIRNRAIKSDVSPKLGLVLDLLEHTRGRRRRRHPDRTRCLLSQRLSSRKGDRSGKRLRRFCFTRQARRQLCPSDRFKYPRTNDVVTAWHQRQSGAQTARWTNDSQGACRARGNASRGVAGRRHDNGRHSRTSLWHGSQFKDG